MSATLISVIIPVFNTREFLPACLDSVVTQSLTELEIICIDDGSTDGSGDILRQYMDRDKRITLLTQKNRGASSAKNQGLALASGEFLAFVDSDDILLPHALSKLYRAINRNDADIVQGGFITRNLHTGKRNSHIVKHEVLKGSQCLEAYLNKKVRPDPWANLFRRSLFVDNNIRYQESIRYATDRLILCKAFHFARKVQLIPDPVYEHTISRPESLVNAYTNKAFLPDKIKVRADIADFIRSQGLWDLHMETTRRINSGFFESMLINIIFDAKGAGYHSIKSFVHMCNKRLPEFDLTEVESLRKIARIVDNYTVEAAGFSTAEKKQVFRYIEDYLKELDTEHIDLNPEERKIVRTLCTVFYKRINNKLVILYYRYCDLGKWQRRIRWLLILVARRDFDKCKVAIKNFLLRPDRLNK